MSVRKVVHIDEEKCNGCGVCVPSCAEGAIQIIGGKARLVSEVYCDGLGACLGHCPQGAITVEEREAADFDEEAVKKHLKAGSMSQVSGFNENDGPVAGNIPTRREAVTPAEPVRPAHPVQGHGGCPGSLSRIPTGGN